MRDQHHYLKQQFIRNKFPRGGVERGELLMPLGKLDDPEHYGHLYYSLQELLDDPRNISYVTRDDHDRHHNAINPAKIDVPAQAWEFARWCGLDWRLEREEAA